MSYTDVVYNALVKKILTEGYTAEPQDVRTKYADGSLAIPKSITGVQLRFDNKEVIIPTTKRVAPKWPLDELFWIWQDKSNVVADLRRRGPDIWDEWEILDPKSIWYGTIGPAYGYQLRQPVRLWRIKDLNLSKLSEDAVNRASNAIGMGQQFILLDQVDHLIQSLLTSSGSRRIMTTLLKVDDLDKMALHPCVWGTHWVKCHGKIDLIVLIRSNDIALGNPFNMFQYAALHHMICQVANHKVGDIIFNIDDAHIYDRHIDGLTQQIQEKTFKSPEMWINPAIENFYDFTVDDIKLIGYEYAAEYKYEIAI